MFMLTRVMEAGTRNFFRNAWLSVAAITVMAVTLTIMLSAVVFNMALGNTLDKVTEKIDVAVYFNDDASRSQIDQFQEALLARGNVTEVEFISKAEARERYRQERSSSGEQPIDPVTPGDNPLPRSVEITVADLTRVGQISDLAQSQQYAPIVEETSLGGDQRDTIQRIATVRESLLTAGLVASLIFAGISVLIIFNTIRMAIFARGEEISIMRLIGATNAFIRGPFLFEAILDGIIAALIALGLVYALLFRSGASLIDYVDFESTVTFFTEAWPLVAGGTILAGVLLGAFSSTLAMARYLRL
jgi:cell division transport system permease protein